jgi:hypothetical protein
MPCAGHPVTLRVDTRHAEDLSSTKWTKYAGHQEQATKQRVFRRQQQCSVSVGVQQYRVRARGVRGTSNASTYKTI